MVDGSFLQVIHCTLENCSKLYFDLVISISIPHVPMLMDVRKPILSLTAYLYCSDWYQQKLRFGIFTFLFMQPA